MCPQDTKRLRDPGYLDNRYMKVARLLSLRTGHLYNPRSISGTHFCSAVVSLGILSEATDVTMCPGVESVSKNEYQENC
jgi:hypothetical protein